MRLNHVAKKILMVGIMMFLFTDCHDSLLDKKSIAKTREFTNLKKDSKLMDLYTGIDKLIPQGRAKEDILERANWNRVYKIDDLQNDRSVYTIPMYVSKPLEFSNLILAELEGQPQGIIITYHPSRSWLSNRTRDSGFKNFTGSMAFSSLEGESIFSAEFVNGIRVESDDENSGRVEECVTYYEATWEIITVPDLGLWYISEVTVVEYEICYEGDGGPGGWGGFFEDGSGGYGGGGGIGVIDPLDIAYYLRPFLQGDDVNYPYDGMRAYDSNGVIYTYNASINAWMLPDVVVLRNNGFQMQHNTTTNYNGRILSTVTAIALVESTPVGEIIVGGIIIGVFVYEAYQITTVGHNDYEICQVLYELCLEQNDGFGECYDCRDECNSNLGAWPTYKCHWEN